MKKKSILCYGDSNTFGYRPMDSQRYPYGIRWTSLLAENLGEDFRVIEAGLNSRTTVIDDDLEKDRNGWKCIDVVMEMNWPLDLVILMLGTNDMKVRYQAEAVDIAEGAPPPPSGDTPRLDAADSPGFSVADRGKTP